MKNKLLTQPQLQRNRLITKARYVVEAHFCQLGALIWQQSAARHCGLAKAHTWHILQAMAYDLKRLPKLYVASFCYPRWA